MSEVVAEVILRGPEGKSIIDADRPPTGSAELAVYQPTFATSAAARAAFESRGFVVHDDGATGFSVSADQDVFEDVFSTHLHIETAADGSDYWRAADAIQIPDDFEPWVAAVVLPLAPEFF